MAKLTVLSERTKNRLLNQRGQRTQITRPRDNAKPRQAVFKNATGATVPPYGVMRVLTAIESLGRWVLQVTMTGNTPGIWVFNGPREVPNGKHGTYQIEPYVIATYTGSTPGHGDTVGIEGFKVKRNGLRYAEFVVMGPLDLTEKLVLLNPLDTQTGRFVTPAGGIAAATTKYKPTFTTSAERLYWNTTTLVWESTTPATFMQLGNSVTAEIPGSISVDAIRRPESGPFLVDVVDCNQP